MLRYLQHNLLCWLGTLACLALLAGCSADDSRSAAAGDEGGRVKVVFSIALQETAAGTRADVDWSNYSPTDLGTEQESNINLDALQVGIYDSNNQLLGLVEKLLVQRVEGSGTTPTYYNVQGSWQPTDEAQLAQAAKLMVVANANATAQLSSDLSTLQFTTQESGTTSANLTYIPMWGVASITSPLQLGKSTDLGEVYLLRSMAKVLVQLTDDMVQRGYGIESVQLNNHNTQGYIVPQGYQGVADTRTLTFAATPRFLSSLQTSAIDFTLPTTATTQQYSQNLYVPEYDNATSTAPSTLTVGLTLNGTHEGTYTFGFYEYTTEGMAQTTKPVDIVRNHYYLFTLIKTNRMNVNLSVRPWRQLQHDQVVM